MGKEKQRQRLGPPQCFVVMTGTVIRLVRGLAGINPTEGLQPARKGLEYIWRLQTMRTARVLKSRGTNNLSVVTLIIEGAIRDHEWTEASLLRFAQRTSFARINFLMTKKTPG